MKKLLRLQTSLRQTPSANASWFRVFLCLAIGFQSALAQRHSPPPRPPVAPLIGSKYPNDANGDRIDDQLSRRAEQAIAAEQAALTPLEKSQARAKLSEPVPVELIFNEPITQQQIDRFSALGGEITYVYKSVSYGWNGMLPLNKVSAVPAALGATLVLIDEPKGGEAQLNLATRTGRVRPVWAPGFAGSAAGFSGSTNITIAIVDSGVDESHADLSGRKVFWHDYTPSNYVSPVDIFGHGSHVAGIALGTGAGSGSGTGTLKLTALRNITSSPNGNFFFDNLELPTNSVNITCTALWNGGDASGTRLRWFQRLRTDPPTTWSGVISTVGTSPLNLNFNLSGLPDRVYSPGLFQSNGITDCVITSQIANYPGVGDGFNKLRGVAPGCNWAGAKALNDAGGYSGSDLPTALDDLVAKRVPYKIKIMNLSLGGFLSGTLRRKINTAVNNGIIMAVSAGNSVTAQNFGTGIGTNFVTEPGRAAMALTVASSSSLNQLTDYSREGFLSPSTTPGQEEDYKPDLMAPGGSVWQVYITSIDSNSGDSAAFADQQPNDYRPMHGTSMAAPFAAGCAALVIDAMDQSGIIWDFNSSQHARFVKMLLCATASESNTNREGANGLAVPILQRTACITNGVEVLPPGKDLAEGYGMINPDAAVEGVALTYTNDTLATATLGPSTTDRRAWARTVNLIGGRNLSVTLTNPVSGDFDLYLYSSTPTAYGTPQLLAFSTRAGNGVAELINYLPDSDQTALLVVKRVSGSGTFNLIGNTAPAADFAADVTSGLAPLTVNFTNLSNGASTSYLWSFGDGNTSTDLNPANTYSNAGSYTVTLTAFGSGGTNTLSRVSYINVANPPPVAAFVASPTNGFAPLTVSFTNLTSGATSYEWNFGDGNTSTDLNPANTYSNAGAYTVTLAAVGAGGTNIFARVGYVLVSAQPMILSPAANGDDFTFSFETIPGKTYTLEYTDSLDAQAWQTLQSVSGDGTLKRITNQFSAAPERFFQLNVR